MDDEEEKRAFEKTFESFRPAHPQYADRTAFDPADKGMAITFGHWSDRCQAAIDDLIPGLPQGEDRGAVLRALIEEFEEWRAELAERRGGILGNV